jgi:hypothetical protein
MIDVGKIVGKTIAKGCMNMPDGATLEVSSAKLEKLADSQSTCKTRRLEAVV